MLLGDKQTFGLVVEQLGLSPTEAVSATARSVARLQVWCAGQNLCAGRDSDGGFDALEVPLLDLAIWLVQGWDELVFNSSTHPVLATKFHHSVPIALRWELSENLALPLAEAQSLHEWASLRALEFAASDYLLPNVVFDRVDDFIRVSWSQRPQLHAFIDLTFAPSSGTLLLDVRDVVETWTALIRAVSTWTRATEDADPRVPMLSAFLARDVAASGRQTALRWAPGLNVSLHVPKPELEALGATGRGGFVSAFLRSSEQVLPVAAVEECLARFAAIDQTLDSERVAALSAGADAAIDPVAPWESGYALARYVRARLSALGVCAPNGPVPIEALFEELGIPVRRLPLGTPDVDGVCLVDEAGRSLALLNTDGTLSRTRVGQRSTLAHELCHFMFDAPRFRMVGQADLRRSPNSLVEKRANAFAAELLLPRSEILAAAGGYVSGRSALRAVAVKFGVGMPLADNQAVNAGVVVKP